MTLGKASCGRCLVLNIKQRSPHAVYQSSERHLPERIGGPVMSVMQPNASFVYRMCECPLTEAKRSSIGCRPAIVHQPKGDALSV